MAKTDMQKAIDSINRKRGAGFAEHVIELYKTGLTLLEMVEEMKHKGGTYQTVREVLNVLHLRRGDGQGRNFTTDERMKYYLNLQQQLGNMDAKEVAEELNELVREKMLLTDKVRKLTKSITLIRDENTLLRRHDRESDRADRYIEAVKEVLLSSDFKTEINLAELPEADNYYGAVYNFADNHVGVRISENETGNKYDKEQFEKDQEYYLSVFFDKYKRGVPILTLMGDILESLGLHKDQLINAEMDIIQQLEYMSFYLFKMIEKFVERYGRLDVVGVVGNHARMDEKKIFSKKYLNYEWILFKNLELMVQVAGLDKVVNFTFHESGYAIKNINGKLVGFMHGDNMRGVTESSVRTTCEYIERVFGSKPDMLVIGHFHEIRYERYGTVEVLQVASGKGYDQYFMGNSFRMKLPAQTTFTIDRGNTCIYNIEKKS